MGSRNGKNMDNAGGGKGSHYIFRYFIIISAKEQGHKDMEPERIHVGLKPGLHLSFDFVGQPAGPVLTAFSQKMDFFRFLRINPAHEPAAPVTPFQINFTGIFINPHSRHLSGDGNGISRAIKLFRMGIINKGRTGK